MPAHKGARPTGLRLQLRLRRGLGWDWRCGLGLKDWGSASPVTEGRRLVREEVRVREDLDAVVATINAGEALWPEALADRLELPEALWAAPFHVLRTFRNIKCALYAQNDTAPEWQSLRD